MNQPKAATNGSNTLPNLPELDEIKRICAELEGPIADETLLDRFPELESLAEALRETGARWHYRHEIPDTAEKDPQLGPYAFRLYGHYQRVGRCFESVGTTHLRTGISTGKVIGCREELAERGYISRRRPSKSGPYHIEALDRPMPEADAEVLEAAGIEPPKGGYTQVPNMADDQLSWKAYRLYMHLRRRAGEEGTCYGSRTGMAEATGLSRRSVGRAITELTEAGYLAEEEGGGLRVRPIWLSNWLRYAAQTADQLREALGRLRRKWAAMKEMGSDEGTRAAMNQRSTPVKNTPSKRETAREEKSPSCNKPSVDRLSQFIRTTEPFDRQFGPEEAEKAARKFRAKYAGTGWRVAGSPIINWKALFRAYLEEWHRRAKKSSEKKRSRNGEETGWMTNAETCRHAQERGLTARGPAYEHNGKTGREARWRYVPSRIGSGSP